MNALEFYDASNLTDNPFRPSAVGVDDPRAGIWVGYDRQRQLLERLLSRVRADQVGLTSFILLYGHWGTGKSHALLWARNWVKEKHAGYAYYISTLKREKGKLSLASAFQEDLLDRSVLTTDLRKYHTWLVKKTLEVMQAHQDMSADDALKRLHAVPEACELARLIYHTEGKEDALKELLSSRLGSEHEAVTLFSKIVNLFVTPIGETTPERFAPAVYLLIDELDDLARQPAKDSLQTNDTLRHLYDACPNSFGLILAASAELNTLQHLFMEYVLSRMTRKIEFEFLDQVAAKEFIKQVLDKSRVRRDPPGQLGFFPLDEESVSTIVSHLRQITPRDVVKTMQQVLEEIRIAEIDPRKGPVTNEKLDEKDVLGFIFDA
jgi:hypothetical protein